MASWEILRNLNKKSDFDVRKIPFACPHFHFLKMSAETFSSLNLIVTGIYFLEIDVIKCLISG